ncbi:MULTISPECIES: ribonuclease E activity regulator RraA [unclassified Curtobacterium]|uniref:ribonuclease E activity regulator RraA n=1 Tax=unclassified Curtobacterium TaxID=257496 RepID=UPI000D9B9152|nr:MULTISPECIES: ribonuclease E activity regulator RraA [unclassified Curtobacterium]PYY53178.1 S-adenosylmethionine--2-demethylmenaquinone methyltransferase [Curtobacterium sp. MCSS17_011]WIE79179.1 ribonuclease E activity regulator RraA [Curtobacterium sp. MCSS17_016]
MTFHTADLYDEHGEALASLSVQLGNYGSALSFSGPIRTVSCFEDNSVLKRVVSEPGNGAVLVVDGHGSLERALMGDMIANIAAQNGWAGVVINGAIRDRAAIATIPLGVKALGTNPRKSVKNNVGEVDVPVVIGGVRFEPGKTIYCDEDGILVER